MTAKGQPRPAGAGRKSTYSDKHPAQARKLAMLGAIDIEIADFFGVSEKTLNTWKRKHPAFYEALQAGKTVADMQVAQALFKRATGYKHPDTDVRVVDGSIVKTSLVKHHAPDTTAAIFWLKNRQPDKWRDVHRTEMTGANGGPIKTESTVTLSAEDAYLRMLSGK